MSATLRFHMPYSPTNDDYSSSVELGLGHQTRHKIAHEAANIDPDLRRMVGLCNTLDSYIQKLQPQQTSSENFENGGCERDIRKVQRIEDIEDYCDEDVPPYSEENYFGIHVRAAECEEDEEDSKSEIESESDSDYDSDYDSDCDSDCDSFSVSDSDSGGGGDYKDDSDRRSMYMGTGETTNSVVCTENVFCSSSWEVNQKLRTLLKVIRC